MTSKNYQRKIKIGRNEGYPNRSVKLKEIINNFKMIS